MFRKQSSQVTVDIIEVAERLGRVLSRESVHARSTVSRAADAVYYDPRSLI